MPATTVAGNSKQYAATLRDLTLMYPAARTFYVTGGVGVDVAAGIAAISATPTASDSGAGTGPTGTYRWYITAYDSTRDSHGNPSPVSNLLTVADNAVTLDLTTIATELTNVARVDRVGIWRNTNGSSVYRLVTTQAKALTSYSDTSTDATIDSNNTLETDNDAPPSMSGVFRHGARLFGWSGSNLYWCKASNPDQWPSLNVLPISRSDGWDIKGLASVGDTLLIFKEHGIHALQYGIDPLVSGLSQPVHTVRGALNMSCIAKCGAGIFVMDAQGIYMLRGLDVIDLSKPMKNTLSRRNMAIKQWFCCEADDRRANFYYAADTDTECYSGVTIDVGALQESNYNDVVWWPTSHEMGVRDTVRHLWATHAGDTGAGTSEVNGLEHTESALVVDPNGISWVTEHLASDGCPTYLETAGTVMSCTNSAGVTQLVRQNPPNSPKFMGNSESVVGCYIRFKLNGEWSIPYRIASVTDANTLKLAVLLSPQPSQNTEYSIGSINQIYDSPQLSFGNIWMRKRPSRLMAAYEPRPSRDVSVEVKVSRDRRGWTLMTRDIDDRGVMYSKGSEGATLRLGGDPSSDGGYGVAEVGLGGGYGNVFQVRLEGMVGNRPISVFNMDVSAEAQIESP